MRSGLILLAGAAGLCAAIVACPQTLRSEMAEKATLPDHIYREAERQFVTFVNWARDPEGRPRLEREEQGSERGV